MSRTARGRGRRPVFQPETVEAGRPRATAAKRCPDCVFLPVEADVYNEVSARVMGVLRETGCPVEVLGWDEAFLGLPDGDGWELIKHIRDSPEHGRMPIVVMTGLLDSAEVLNRAYDLECEYLGKPFAPEALIAKVESARRIVGGASEDMTGISFGDITRAPVTTW